MQRKFFHSRPTITPCAPHDAASVGDHGGTTTGEGADCGDGPRNGRPAGPHPAPAERPGAALAVGAAPAARGAGRPVPDHRRLPRQPRWAPPGGGRRRRGHPGPRHGLPRGPRQHGHDRPAAPAGRVPGRDGPDGPRGASAWTAGWRTCVRPRSATGPSRSRRGAARGTPGCTGRPSRSRPASTSSSSSRRAPCCSSAPPPQLPAGCRRARVLATAASAPWWRRPCPCPSGWPPAPTPASPPSCTATRCARASPRAARGRFACSGAARSSAPGTSSSPAARARRSTRPAPAPSAPRPASTPSRTWASTSSTCRRSTRSAASTARAPTTP